MTTRKRNKWQGFIDERDVAPELLEKIHRYYEVYNANEAKDAGCGSPSYGSAHRLAREAVPLTADEEDIRKRLDPFGSIKG